jgi:hypothetical protein
MWPNDTRTPMRKRVDSFWVYPKRDLYYIATDIMSKTSSTVLFTFAYCMWDSIFQNLPESAGRDFLRLRGFPDVYGVELVDKNRTCFSNVEITAFVRSFNKKDWEKNKYYGVRILNAAKESDTKEEKNNSLNNLITRCGCERDFYAGSCRAPSWVRKMFGDKRDVNSKPGPFINAMFCNHVSVAFDYLYFFSDPTPASFGYFGLPQQVVEYTEKIIGDIVVHRIDRKNHPDYLLNDRYRHFNRYMNAGLEAMLF